MKKIIILIVVAFSLTACGSSDSPQTTSSGNSKPKSMVPDRPVDDGKGIGEVKNVTLNDPLDPQMSQKGKAIYEMKCASCHKLTSQRVVGPGWEGITERRKPEWIMNMATNVEVMLEEDPAAQEMLKECLVRMPNQNLTIGDARDVLEFMFENDSSIKASEK
ncbi:MAG: cytochrome c [Saprospiraceae bacterium]|nr:cytochrome c [Saprospiraceae bacterium]